MPVDVGGYRLTSEMEDYLNPQIVTDGLVLHLDVGNTNSYPGTGTTWTDLSGNGNNGTLVNGVSYSSTYGGVFTLDGSNDYINIPDNPSIDFNTGEFTVLMWVAVSGYPGSAKTLIHKGSQFDGNLAGWSMAWAGSPQDLYFIISSGSSRIEGRTVPNGGLNGWSGYKMIGMQRSGSTFNQINNTTITSLGSFSGNVDNNYPINIGYNSVYNTYMSFGIGTVLVYNQALTSTEIQQNYNFYKNRFGL